MSGAELDVAAVMRGEQPAVGDALAFAEAAARHRVAALLVHLAPHALPEGAAHRLGDEARRQAAVWAVRHRELRRIAEAAAGAQMDVLAVKGVHLAYTRYPDLAARECLDADLFVRPSQFGAFLDVLVRLGFVRSPANVGDAALGQTIFEKPGIPGSVIDVHSRLLSAAALAEHLDFEPLWHRSMPLARIGPGLRAPSTADALRIAVLHQAVHHPGRSSLRWLYDIHLLLRDMPEQDAGRCAEGLARAGLLSGAYPIGEAQELFPTSAGAAIAARLPPRGQSPLVDAVPARQLLRDVRALGTWRERLRFARGHLLPPADYMRRTYAPGDRRPLLLLYVLRVLRGVRGWL